MENCFQSLRITTKLETLWAAAGSLHRGGLLGGTSKHQRQITTSEDEMLNALIFLISGLINFPILFAPHKIEIQFDNI